MDIRFWILAAIALAAVNYGAARNRNPVLGRLVLWGSIGPALALVGITGFRLLYAIVESEEVNARFAAGDPTYFGADLAFVVSLGLGALWVGIACAAFRIGRARPNARR